MKVTLKIYFSINYDKKKNLFLKTTDSLNPMEKICETSDYPNVPSINKNQTGWHWFGSIVGKNPEPKLAMAEALDSLIGRFIQNKSLLKIFFSCKINFYTKHVF